VPGRLTTGAAFPATEATGSWSGCGASPVIATARISQSATRLSMPAVSDNACALKHATDAAGWQCPAGARSHAGKAVPSKFQRSRFGLVMEEPARNR